MNTRVCDALVIDTFPTYAGYQRVRGGPYMETGLDIVIGE